jgi:hypothetical protein
MTTTATAPPIPALQETLPAAEARPAAVRLDRSLIDRACLGDQEALQTILHQFIDADEPIEWCNYLGTLGIQPFGRKSFAVLTRRRIGSLQVGWFGFIQYQDAPLEYTVSGLIAQPSKLGLYLWLTFNTLAILVGDYVLFTTLVRPASAWGIVALFLAALVLAFAWAVTVRLYYAFNKCGLLWAVREGLWVYAFTNRGRMNVANRLYRQIVAVRERRLREVQPIP